jgi:aryl-alcohol dehydrogenase-like predicted oxidoreductase
MMFGDQTSEAEAERIVGTAADAGVNFIDTADAYAGGESESMVGRLLAKSRDDWVIATKVGTAIPPTGPNRKGHGRLWMIRSIESSLRRLQTDYVDLYYLHFDDLEVALEETVATIGDLIRASKIRYWGVSNHRAWRIAEIVRVCAELGTPKPIAAQPVYNIMNRMAEVEYLPACNFLEIGVVPYSPLARGVLTGKYRPGTEPDPSTRAGRHDRRIMQTEFRPESLIIAQTIKEHAEASGRTPVGIAINWVLAHPYVTSVIAGPRLNEQWSTYLSALTEDFSAADEDLVDRLVPKGYASSHGYADPLYPVLGRPRHEQ